MVIFSNVLIFCHIENIFPLIHPKIILLRGEKYRHCFFFSNSHYYYSCRNTETYHIFMRISHFRSNAGFSVTQGISSTNWKAENILVISIVRVLLRCHK